MSVSAASVEVEVRSAAPHVIPLSSLSPEASFRQAEGQRGSSPEDGAYSTKVHSVIAVFRPDCCSLEGFVPCGGAGPGIGPILSDPDTLPGEHSRNLASPFTSLLLRVGLDSSPTAHSGMRPLRRILVLLGAPFNAEPPPFGLP